MTLFTICKLVSGPIAAEVRRAMMASTMTATRVNELPLAMIGCDLVENGREWGRV